MRKFWIFLLFMAAMLLLIGCSWFDSEPVKPKILGITHVVEDRGLVYVEIDSIRYPVDYVKTGEEARFDNKPSIKPADGMLVTVAYFTGKRFHGIQFLLGEWDEQKIEAYFHRNYTFGILVGIGTLMTILYVLGQAIYSESQEVQRQRKRLKEQSR